jgi:excisionase family DNA binding protein
MKESQRLLYSRRDAAGALSVSVDTLERMIKRGDITAVRIGRRGVRVPRSELDAFIDRKATGLRTPS